jgi:hypothetical protein
MKVRAVLAPPVLAAVVLLSACQDAVTEPQLAEESREGRILSLAGDRRCNTGNFPASPLVGTFDNVIVPPGGFCLMFDSKVRGNVKALQNARLRMFNTIVRGNVEGDKPSSVHVHGGTVYGNIHIVEAGDDFFTSAAVFGVILPNGNIQIEKGRSSFGGWRVEDNTLKKGNIQVVENGFCRNAENSIVGNHVAGDIQVFKNSGCSPKTVANNTVGGNLQCKENTPSFSLISYGNTVRGNAEDQCADGTI